MCRNDMNFSSSVVALTPYFTAPLLVQPELLPVQLEPLPVQPEPLPVQPEP